MEVTVKMNSCKGRGCDSVVECLSSMCNALTLGLDLQHHKNQTKSNKQTKKTLQPSMLVNTYSSSTLQAKAGEL
jgi:hypothetical protein